jgi:3-hydroxyisobutyrate dehydrogenase-like beta-hydroxyacid dehydrogenase
MATAFILTLVKCPSLSEAPHWRVQCSKQIVHLYTGASSPQGEFKMKRHVGIIGLGIMGGAMAEALIAAGHRVSGYDVHPAARQRLKRAGGHVLSSCAKVASAVDVVITSLPSVKALDAVAHDIAVECGAKLKATRSLIVIETSTLPIADKERALGKLKKAGVTMIDCPISGTAQRMKEGSWTIFVSGSPGACKSVRSILEVFTRNAPYVGAFGHGSKMKFIANHLVAIYNVAVGETMTFARTMGLDPQQVWDLFAASPVVGTGVFKLRGKFMVDRKYVPPTMKVEVWQKDMQVIGDMARSVNCPLPLFTACVPVYNAAMAQGLAQSDTASVCEVLDAAAGGKR